MPNLFEPNRKAANPQTHLANKYDYCTDVVFQHPHPINYFMTTLFTAALLALHCPKLVKSQKLDKKFCLAIFL